MKFNRRRKIIKDWHPRLPSKLGGQEREKHQQSLMGRLLTSLRLHFESSGGFGIEVGRTSYETESIAWNLNCVVQIK